MDLTTNGTLLTPKLIKALVNSGLTRVIISVNGLSKESYKKNCGIGIDFDKYVCGIRSLFEASREKFVIHIKIIDELLTETETADMFYSTFDKICDRMYIEHLENAMGFEHGHATDKRYNRHNELITTPRKVCAVPFYLPGIHYNGDVSPCCHFMPPEHCIGNIATQQLQEIWNGEKHLDFLKQQLTLGHKAIPVCANCDAIHCINTPEENLDGHTEEILARLGA
jgi:radical SAM protein with 4Fe4S-binding SPASM domain